MNTKKILVISAYQPNAKNEGGGPTGLLWEIIDYLTNELKIKVDTEVYPMSTSKLIRVINRNGFYLGRHKRITQSYSNIIVYPEQMLFFLQKEDWKRTIVLGPDSPSLRDARVYRTKKSCVGRLIKLLMIKIARYNEYIALKNVFKYIVVGSTDKKYMHANKYLLCNNKLKEKILFLRHPMLSNVINMNIPSKIKHKRFVFSITPQQENQSFINALINELKVLEIIQENNMEIILVGKSSEWMKRLFGKLKKCKVNYYSWIDNYEDLCLFGVDVHCLPILSGSGTKNRTLTALGSYLLVISTPIGIENIPRRGEQGVFVTSSPIEFAQIMVNLNDNKIEINNDRLIDSRKKLIRRIFDEYEGKMKKIFRDDAN